MKRLAWLLLFGILLTSLTSALAQSEGQFFYQNERAETVDEAILQAAVQPLLDQGARVAIYLINGGGADDFNERLQADGLLQGDLLANDLIAIYVSFDPRYSEIAWGDNWSATVGRSAESIRQSALNANLREAQYERALTRSLEEFVKVIENPPAVSAALPTQAPYNPSANINKPVTIPSYYDYKTEDDTDSSLMTLFLCLMVPFGIFSWVIQMANGGDGEYYGGSPSYKSSWKSSSSFSKGSSHRSSGSRSSFGRGGRSGGGW